MTAALTFPTIASPWAPSMAGWLPAMGPGVWLRGALFVGSSMLALSWLAPAAKLFTPRAGTVPLAQTAAVAVALPLVSFGVVRAIRELSSEGGGARRFEMTIRMQDGTLRTSNETGGANWRAGDKVQLIGAKAAG